MLIDSTAAGRVTTLVTNGVSGEDETSEAGNLMLYEKVSGCVIMLISFVVGGIL
ncbi:MAG: hypothetical protein QOC81_1684 [Thermoanaerobaculia bacterium]|jgi:hypothetical protein|nr:hypothetical protein [Thermoanaerobaculia bacterium]